MRILVKRNLGKGFPAYLEGEVVDCKQPLADLLVANGLAEKAPDPPAKAAKEAPAKTKAAKTKSAKAEIKAVPEESTLEATPPTSTE